MAKLILNDARVEVNGVNVSDHTQSITIETTRDDVDLTAMGAVNKVVGPGLGDATISATFFQDFGAASIDATLFPLSTATTPFTVKVRPTSGAISATNPEYVLTVNMYGYKPLDGSVGDASTTDVEFRNASQTGLVRNIT